MKKLLGIVVLGLIFVSQSYAASKQNPLKVFKNEILGADAKKMEISMRSIKKTKKVLSIVGDEDDKAVKIKITKKLKGHKDDWNNTGGRAQRWELDAKGTIKHGTAIYGKYTFKIDDKSKADGSIFQSVGTDKNGSPIIPATQIVYWSDDPDYKEIVFAYHLVNKAAYPCNEDNSFFEKISYYFKLGFQKSFENFRTIAFKHVPSKDKNGEYIMWLNDEKVVELYGPNMAVGEGIKYRIGLYRWLNKKSKGPTSLTIKEFSYSENCEEVLDSSKCNYNTDEKRLKKKEKGMSFAWVPYKKKNTNEIKKDVKYCKVFESNLSAEGLKIFGMGKY